MKQQSNATDMSAKVTLTVYKNSPHIWAGGLTDVELAEWLICKANALIWRLTANKKREETRKRLADAEACAQLIESYTNLGISSAENDSIQPLSMEAIQYASFLGRLVIDGAHAEGISAPPTGYSLIPELAAIRQQLQQKKSAVLELLEGQYGEILAPEQRQCPEGYDWSAPLFEDHQ